MTRVKDEVKNGEGMQLRLCNENDDDLGSLDKGLRRKEDVGT